jgi:ATP-dependent helicase IRC3
MLRPYQQAALAASKQRFVEAKVTRQLIALPTGTGKTIIFANLRNHHQINGRILVLVHTEELAKQAFEKLRKYNPGVSIGIEMADQECRLADQIVVGSVPTLGRSNSGRLRFFAPQNFGAIICDEAHHATADTYGRIFRHFGVHTPSCRILLLGCTATPYRRNGDQLRSVFDETVFQMGLDKAIRDGWLVDLRGYRIRSSASLVLQL